VCRQSSTLGLEQPGDATGTLAPELEKMLDAAATDTVSVTMAPENPTSADAEFDTIGAGDQPGIEEEPVVSDVNPEMP
jgi:hypothetical protein